MHRHILALSLLPLGAAAAQGRSAVVEIDHGTGRMRYIVAHGGRADTTVLAKDGVVRTPRGVPVVVRVVNTNTALYRYAERSEAAPLPEQQQLKAFTGRAQPYVPELRAALKRGRGRGDAEEQTAAEREAALVEAVGAANAAFASMERGLVAVDEALYGRGGLQDLRTTTLVALEQMRRGAEPERAAAPVRALVGVQACAATDSVPVRVASVAALLDGLQGVVQGAQQVRLAVDGAPFAGEPRWRVVADSAQRLESRAAGALADVDALVDGAYRLEQIVGAVAGACSQWRAGEYRGSETKGRDVTIEVTPRGEPELSRVASREPVSYTVRIQPRPIVRPLLSVAAIAVPDARFARYGTLGTDAGDLQVVERGTKDARFAVGATLGFTWPGLDRRETGGITAWVPELVVGTGGDARAFGVGPALSWRFLKVGAGAMWVRRASLAGVQVGDVLPAGSTVPTSDSYGAPKLYLALSAVDWSSPFDRR